MPKGSISPYQVYALIVNSVIGVGVLLFPRSMAKEMGTDGILVIPLVGIIAGIMLFVISKLGGLFPGRSLVGISREILGIKRYPWLGKILSVVLLAIFLVNWLGGMVVVTRTFGQVLVTAVFQRTPIVVVMLMLVAAAAYVSHSRVDVLARFNEFLLPLIYAPGILLIAALIQVGEVEHLLPLFQADWKQVVKGASTALFSYTGFEVTLVFMGAYQEPKKALRPYLTAIFVITVFGYWLTYLICLSVFGKEELTLLAWPVLELVKAVHIPGMIFERLESAVVSIWVIAVFTTITNTMFAIVQTLQEFLGLADRRRKWLTLAVGGTIYGLALWPTNIYEMGKWGELMGYWWFFSILLVPPLLYVIARIRRRRGEKRGESPSV
ncbi:GerAB/ArcD/ProY family transporter [Planifilum fulgidum]|nr:endospore germination permease [Planifilum fulgidum]